MPDARDPGPIDAAILIWNRRWRLTADGEAFVSRAGSILAPVRTAAGEAAMLKIAGDAEERRGAAIMDWWAGDGAARVLARAGEALLLERAQGPRSLAAMARDGHDAEATDILVTAAAALHAPRTTTPPADLVPLEIWFRALFAAGEAQGGPFREAADVARALLASPAEPPRPLHGDLHHGNVLDGGARGWLAIDPKGLVGERAFDFANLFRNPDAACALAPGRMADRLARVATAADLDPRRLRRFVQAHAALGAAWSLQAGQTADAAIGLETCRAAAALGAL